MNQKGYSKIKLARYIVVKTYISYLEFWRCKAEKSVFLRSHQIETGKTYQTIFDKNGNIIENKSGSVYYG